MHMDQATFNLPAYPRGFHLVTHHVEAALPPLPVTGLLHLFIQHTSAGLTLNENADPTVRSDFAASLDALVREDDRYTATATAPQLERTVPWQTATSTL